jgi:hypothetical protein
MMTRAGIFKQSMGARNRVGIVLSYLPQGYIGWWTPFLGIDPGLHVYKYGLSLFDRTALCKNQFFILFV